MRDVKAREEAKCKEKMKERKRGKAQSLDESRRFCPRDSPRIFHPIPSIFLRIATFHSLSNYLSVYTRRLKDIPEDSKSLSRRKE